MSILFIRATLFILLSIAFFSCSEKRKIPSRELIESIKLKRGEVISCSSGDHEFGKLDFSFSGSENIKKDFNTAVMLLHSFEYDEAEKVFASVIDKEPGCAMAYWGVAMSNFHALWAPPSSAELQKGAKAVEIALSIEEKSERESDYINAIAAFYKDADKADHRTRCIRFENAMEKLYLKYGDDKEAAIFYALALNAAADPADKTFQKQKKAGGILTNLYPGEPDHPGIVHYIIHTYDYPQLAELGLPAARKYAAVAPSSAHALHMPSHIFTRLGLWDECIKSNLASVSNAKCYAESAGIRGHWDEELHGMDYLVYAYLQKGNDNLAKKQWDYLKTIKEVYPVNFKVAYAFAAIPSRYLLENKLWQQAASLETHDKNFPWKDYPWQNAIIHFTRLLGAVHMGNMNEATSELHELNALHDGLVEQKDSYKAGQVEIQIKASEAWINLKNGKGDDAIRLMKLAADLEEKTGKHPVTPGEIMPAGELLGDLLLEMKRSAEALEAYEAVLKTHPNRFNALYGAGLSAERSGNSEKSGFYYGQLLNIADSTCKRQELSRLKLFAALKKHP